MYFPIEVHYNILNMAIFKTSSSILGGHRHVRPLSFCGKLNNQHLSFDVFFDLMILFAPFRNVEVPIITF